MATIYVTMDGDRYSVDCEKRNGKFIYIYQWLNCPADVSAITTNKVQSKRKLSSGDIVQWIQDLKKVASFL